MYMYMYLHTCTRIIPFHPSQYQEKNPVIDTTQPWDNDEVTRSMEDNVEEQVEIVLPQCELGKLKDIVSHAQINYPNIMIYMYVFLLSSWFVSILLVLDNVRVSLFVLSKKAIYRSCLSCLEYVKILKIPMVFIISTIYFELFSFSTNPRYCL